MKKIYTNKKSSNTITVIAENEKFNTVTIITSEGKTKDITTSTLKKNYEFVKEEKEKKEEKKARKPRKSVQSEEQKALYKNIVTYAKNNKLTVKRRTGSHVIVFKDASKKAKAYCYIGKKGYEILMKPADVKKGYSYEEINYNLSASLKFDYDGKEEKTINDLWAVFKNR